MQNKKSDSSMSNKTSFFLDRLQSLLHSALMKPLILVFLSIPRMLSWWRGKSLFMMPLPSLRSLSLGELQVKMSGNYLCWAGDDGDCDFITILKRTDKGGVVSSDRGFYRCVTDTGFWSVKQGLNPVVCSENNIPCVSVLWCDCCAL